MKTIYSRPECSELTFSGQNEILAGSYNQGGASPYTENDIFDNGSY